MSGANVNAVKRMALGISVAAAMAMGGAVTSAQAAYTADTLLGQSNLGNSGDATETQALQNLLTSKGIFETVVLDEKLNSQSFTAIADGANQWYIDVAPDTPGYFALKLGTGGTNATADTFFFRNIAELTKLVWTNADVEFLTGGDCRTGNDSACNIGRLSHYTTFNPTAVPEPGSLALAGLALAALGFTRRQRHRRDTGAA